MGVIDIHAHAFPDKLAQRAMPALETEANWEAVLDGRLKSLLKSMDKADIDMSVVCSIATKPDQVEDIFLWCCEIRSERIEPFPSIHPDTPDIHDWIDRFCDEGFVGIKLHPMYQGFAADEPRAMAIYEAAADADLTVVLHCGRDVAFPLDDDRAEPVRVRHVVDSIPELKLIATHMGGWRMWDESLHELVGSRCYMETSFTFTVPVERLMPMIHRHGTDRVLFGTDSPWADQAQEVDRIQGLDLSEEELDKIMFSNAAKLLRL